MAIYIEATWITRRVYLQDLCRKAEGPASSRTGFKVMFGVGFGVKYFGADKCDTAGSDLCEGVGDFVLLYFIPYEPLV